MQLLMEVLNFDAMQNWGMIDDHDHQWIQDADDPQTASRLFTDRLTLSYPPLPARSPTGGI